ncbi:MAG TPA: MarR family transcriptional regulator [Firmicutes bacterium]|nr:MarR family transcriptional regulator [Bacillota bacterium]
MPALNFNELKHNLSLLQLLLEEVIMPEALAAGSGGRDFMSKARLAAMRFVSNHPGAAPGQAAQALGISAPSMTNLINRLVKSGWLVKKESADDQRGVTLSLTAEGKRVLDKVEKAYRRALEAFLDQMSDEELQHLHLGVTGMLRVAGRAVDEQQFCLQCGLHHTESCILAQVRKRKMEAYGEEDQDK